MTNKDNGYQEALIKDFNNFPSYLENRLGTMVKGMYYNALSNGSVSLKDKTEAENTKEVLSDIEISVKNFFSSGVEIRQKKVIITLNEIKDSIQDYRSMVDTVLMY
jgi:hypothetical protein